MDDWHYLCVHKSKVFKEPAKEGHRELDETLLKHFHPSFEGVKDLIHQWLSTLRTCYTYPERWSSVHEVFLKQINDVIDKFEEPSDAVYRKYSEDENRRRKEHLKNIEVFRRDRNGEPFVTGSSILEDTPTKKNVVGRRVESINEPGSGANSAKDPPVPLDRLSPHSANQPSGSSSKRSRK